MRITIPLGTAFSKGRDTVAGMASLVNMYVEEVKAEQRTRTVCYSAPGTGLFSTIGGGGVRGQINASAVHYAVVGTRLYSITSGGVTTDLGEIEGTELVDMSYNGAQIDIVAELKSYQFDTATLTLTEIADPSFEQASSCASVSSYSIYAVKGTGRFRWRLVNVATFAENDKATAESESDNLVAARKIGNEVALLGSTSIEWWYATGDSGANAFARTSTVPASIGCVARGSALVVDSALMFVGRDGRAGGVSVYRSEGYNPKKISSPQVDTYLESVTDLTQLRAFSYQQRGHLFYVLTNPQEWTLAWDISTGIWSYRKTGSFSMGAEPSGAWDAVTFALNGSKQIVGASDGNLYELQADTLTEMGEPIIREATSGQISTGSQYTRMSDLFLDMRTGVGLISGQGSNPLVYESHSDDGGKTWSVPREATMGAIGEHTWIAQWQVLGMFQFRIFKFRCSDPVDVAFLSAYANISKGSR